MLQAPAFTAESTRGNRNHEKHKSHKTSFSISSLADPMALFVPFVTIEIQTANGFSATWSLTDSGGKTLDPNKGRPTTNFTKGSLYCLWA